jgi:hypothetical protein
MLDREVVHTVVAGYNVDHYCQYNQPQQYEPLLLQISNSTGQRYHQPQQYEPLLCQTKNSNGQYYNLPRLTEEWFILLRVFILLTITV